jgi:hypothetical protein
MIAQMNCKKLTGCIIVCVLNSHKVFHGVTMYNCGGPVKSKMDSLETSAPHQKFSAFRKSHLKK